jgi:peptide/nickel transport system substrate-binding protein
MTSRRQFLAGLPLGTLSLATGAVWSGNLRAAQNDTVTLAFQVDVPSWDPGANSSQPGLAIQKSVFETPLEVSPNLEILPGVAVNHRWLDTEGKVLELTIREGVTFHNGDPLTSDDIKFTFLDRPKHDSTLMISGTFGAIVTGLETPSPTTAVFHFASPYLEAVPLLATISGYILPRRYFEAVGQQGFIEKPIGSGPYRLIDYQRDSRIVLEAYDAYWRGPAPFKRVIFQIIKDSSARAAAIQSGQVDFADNIPIRDIERLAKIPGLVADQHPLTLLMLIHMVNKGVYQDRNLRLAMHHAIDKQILSKAFFGGRAIPQSMYSAKGLPGNEPSFEFAYDPNKAKALLAQSGYSLEKPARIQIGTFNGVFPADFDVARALVQMWKQVGIDADLKVLVPAQYFELTRSAKLEHPMLYVWTDSVGDPQMFTGLVLDPKKRYSLWKSDDIPPRLEPLFREIDAEKRMAGYRKFEVWAVEQGYALPLLQLPAAVVHSRRVSYVPFRNGWVIPYKWTPAA